MKTTLLTAKYQLGSTHTKRIRRTPAGLQRAIRDNRQARRAGGDEQGVWYVLADRDTARALGCYETKYGDWIEPQTKAPIIFAAD